MGEKSNTVLPCWFVLGFSPSHKRAGYFFMKWLTDELKEEIRTCFEKKYERRLSEEDILEIAENLTSLIVTITKFKIHAKN